MRRFALLLLGVAAPAFAADQFDLACQGMRTTTRQGQGQPFSTRVHVDVAAQQWCQDACERVTAIAAATDDQLTLQDDSVLNTREESTTEASFDRRTNAFRQLRITERPEVSYSRFEGSCTIQPFTPFPKARP